MYEDTGKVFTGDLGLVLEKTQYLGENNRKPGLDLKLVILSEKAADFSNYVKFDKTGVLKLGNS